MQSGWWSEEGNRLNVLMFVVSVMLGLEVHAYLSHGGDVWCTCWPMPGGW